MHAETGKNTGPGYMGWKIDEEVEDIEKDNYMWKAFSELQKVVNRHEEKIKSLEEEYKGCIKALKEETHKRTKAEEEVKVLKEIIDSQGKVDNQIIEDEYMEIDDATGVWIQQQKRKNLKLNKEKKVTQSYSYSCQQCSESFSEQRDFEKHQTSHGNITQYKCKLCSERFDEKALLDSHIDIHSQTGYSCEVCNNRFERENMLLEHKKAHVKISSYKCENCGGIFSQKEEMLNHMEAHEKDPVVQEIKCSKCDKSYLTMSKLRRHDWRSHRIVNCNICGLSLQSREEISEHRKTEHNMSRKIKCRYFPNCIDENECFFDHNEKEDKQTEERGVKSRYCLKGENCENQSCEYSEVNHMNVKNVMCRYQAKCNKTECMFKHIIERASFLEACTQNYKRK